IRIQQPPQMRPHSWGLARHKTGWRPQVFPELEFPLEFFRLRHSAAEPWGTRARRGEEKPGDSAGQSKPQSKTQVSLLVRLTFESTSVLLACIIAGEKYTPGPSDSDSPNV